MKPLLAEDGTPLMAPDGTPLIGDSADCADCCANFNGCTSCDCFNRASAFDEVRLIVTSPPIQLVNGDEGDEGCGFISNLVGFRTLIPWGGCSSPSASLCGGCYIDYCAQSSPLPKIRGFHYAVSGIMPNDGEFEVIPGEDNDCAIAEFYWEAKWYVTIDTVSHKLSVFLAFHWIGAIGCPSVCGSRVISYIRWEYNFNSCDELRNPTHVRTMMWHAWGETLNEQTADGVDDFSDCLCAGNDDPGLTYLEPDPNTPTVGTCQINPDEWEATASAFLGGQCAIYTAGGFIGRVLAPDQGTHYITGNLDPPQLQIEACGDACCFESPGGPTASIEITDQAGCQYTAVDTSTPGGCGDIVRRLWVLEQFEEIPSPSDSDVCADRQDTISSDEFGIEYTNEVFLAAYGCGTHIVRITLYVWDVAGCMDSASTGYLGCCGCTDLDGSDCPAPSGSLSISQPDVETFPCRYRLTASIAASSVGTCNDDPPYVPSIRWWRGSQGSECGPDDTPSCDNWTDYCGGSLGDGEHFDIDIGTCETIFWQTQGDSCGCLGPVVTEDICCVSCECCIGPIQGATVTVSGITGCPEDGVACSPCETLNGEYDIPANYDGGGGCVGRIEIPVECVYDIDGTPAGSGYYFIEWHLFCDEDGIYVEVNQGYELAGGATTGGAVVIFLTNDLNTECVDLSGSDTYVGGALCLFCNHSNVGISISFY